MKNESQMNDCTLALLPLTRILNLFSFFFVFQSAMCTKEPYHSVCFSYCNSYCQNDRVPSDIVFIFFSFWWMHRLSSDLLHVTWIPISTGLWHPDIRGWNVDNVLSCLQFRNNLRSLELSFHHGTYSLRRKWYWGSVYKNIIIAEILDIYTFSGV